MFHVFIFYPLIIRTNTYLNARNSSSSRMHSAFSFYQRSFHYIIRYSMFLFYACFDNIFFKSIFAVDDVIKFIKIS